MKTIYTIVAALLAIVFIGGSVMLFRSEPPRRTDAHGHGHGEAEVGHQDHADGDDHAHAEGDDHAHSEGDDHAHAEGDDHAHAEGDDHAHAEVDDHGHAEEGNHRHDHENEPSVVGGMTFQTLGTLKMTNEAIKNNGVEIRSAGPGVINRTIELPGEIVLNSDKVAHIVPRFPGIVQEVRANLGDRVAAGEPLAVIQSNQSVSAYDVKSLVAGTVIEKHITLGEFVRDDQDIYVVADLSTVWVRISVYARYLADIKIGQQVSISAAGPDNTVTGKIDYLGPIVGERTRTTQARVSLNNSKGMWRPGSFVTALVSLGSQPVDVAVPQDAIQTVEGKTVVFVQIADSFEARSVTLGRTDGVMVEVSGGLNKGDLYVASNSFLLKAEFGKSEAGHEH